MISNYICECQHHDFSNRDFTYWENRNVTKGEQEIINFILKTLPLKNKNILHIGIGNSFFYKKIKFNNKIFGITLSNKEICLAKTFNDNNYKVFYCDKYSYKLIDTFKNIKFDYIIDNNLKSYSCCNKTFFEMFKNLVTILNPFGKIITSIEGMNWKKKLVPKLSFNLKNFFHFKLKEISTNSDNIFSLEEAFLLSKEHSLNLIKNKKIVCFSKDY